jgi:hypothetical protein
MTLEINHNFPPDSELHRIPVTIAETRTNAFGPMRFSSESLLNEIN